MDIAEVVQILRTHLSAGTLTLPATPLRSPGIASVFSAYLPAATLVLENVGGVDDKGSFAQVTGRGGRDGPFANMAVTLKIETPGQVAQIDLTADAVPGWTWAESFPALGPTLLPVLNFSAASFELASQPPAPARSGLTFSGTVSLVGELGVLAWLLDGSASLRLSGPVDLDRGVPLPALAAKVSKGVDLGLVQLPYVTFQVGASLVQQGGTSPPAPLGYLGLATEIDFMAAGTRVTLPLSTTFGLDLESVLLSVDLTQLGKKIDAGLSDLASLLGGRSFAKELAGVPISSLLTLKALMVQVDLRAKRLSAIRVLIGSSQEWTILNEGRAPAETSTAVFMVEDIEIVLALNPPTCSQPGVAIFGTVMLGGGTLGASAIFPDFAFSLELQPGTSIDLTEVIEHFLGRNPDIPALQVTTFDIDVDRAAQTYTGALAVNTNWSIPIGSTSLTVQEIGVSIARSAGTTTAHLEGSIELAGAYVTTKWDLPGALQISGSLPRADLSELVRDLSPTHIRADFPSIALVDTDIYIERAANGAYYLAAGTTVPRFGAFQVSFRDVSGQTGWVIGFVLEDGWSLESINPAFKPLSFLILRKAGLMYATMDDPNFTFRSFTDPDFTFPPQLPNAPPGAHKGMSLFGELALSGGPLGTIAKVLRGVDGLLLSASFPDTYSRTVFKAGRAAPLAVIPKVVVFDDIYVSFAPGQERFGLHLNATFTVHGDSIGLSGDILVAAGVATIELRTTTPWVKPFGIANLTLEGMGVSIAVGDELVLSLAGKVAIGQGATQVTLEVAAEFNTAEEGMPDVLLARESGTITLAEIVDTFTTSNLPAFLATVSLSDFQFLLVANPQGWDDPLDNKHYQPGLALGGTLGFFGLEARFALQVEATRGVFASGQIDKPLVLDVLTVANATNPQTGPYVELNTANSPYFTFSAAVSLFELRTVVDAELDSSGFHFNFKSAVQGVGEIDFAIALKDRTAFSLAALVDLSLKHLGPIKAGRFHLGTLKIDLALKAHFGIAADTRGNFFLSIGAQLTFEGVAFRLDDLTLKDKITRLDQLPGVFAENLAALLWDIAKSLLQDADTLFQLIGRGVLGITDDIAHILHEELKVPLEKAARLLKSVSAALAWDARKVASLLASGFGALDHEVAAAMRAAAYDVTDIADAIGHVFGKGAEAVAAALRTAGFDLKSIATALKKTFGYDAEKVASFFKKSWGAGDKAVHEALSAAGYAGSEIDKVMKSLFGWVDHAVDKAKHALNPKHW